ncbi:MAG: FAD-dependent oxidoreductase [Deltaproteobacteria bacterium]|nr:FAD-dependent oxidoreductase [Deltaproteobacteria bacterium]
MLPIEQACFWLANLPPHPVHALAGTVRADVAIVGAGLTGLWTALFLKELDPAREVAVVEQGIAAWGASGRNAGMLAETVDHGHAAAIEHFGEAEAARLARLGEKNVAEMIAFLAERGVDCDFEPTGRMMVALTEAQVLEAQRAVETAARLGVHTYAFRDREAVQAEVHSPLYRGAVSVRGGGILDPAKLTDGLRREAERRGVTVYERSPVVAVRTHGSGASVETAGGRIDASRVVLATSAYTHRLLPRVARWFLPLWDYILVSEPLDERQWHAVGWRGRQGISDGRTFFNYYRPTRDGRVLWGTSEAVYYRGDRVGPECEHSEPHYAALRESWRRHFPQLADLRFEYAWGGAICSTTRLTPFFGHAHDGRVLYGLGFTGHGLGTTRIAGRILAHLALERRSDLLDLTLVRRKPFPLPPGPLRGFAVDRVTRDLRRVDEGGAPSVFLRLLDRLGIGFSS